MTALRPGGPDQAADPARRARCRRAAAAHCSGTRAAPWACRSGAGARHRGGRGRGRGRGRPATDDATSAPVARTHSSPTGTARSSAQRGIPHQAGYRETMSVTFHYHRRVRATCAAQRRRYRRCLHGERACGGARPRSASQAPVVRLAGAGGGRCEYLGASVAAALAHFVRACVRVPRASASTPYLASPPFMALMESSRRRASEA